MLYDYYWLSMIPVGMIFLIVGLSLYKKSGLFMHNYEYSTAYVREILRAKRSHSGRRRNVSAVYIPYAEYTLGGDNINGKHFIPIKSKFINFHEGDIITVKVNNKKPELFCIETIDVNYERKMGVKMIVFGVVVIAASLFIMFVRLSNR